MNTKVFKHGLLTGLTLQLSLGPVFFFIVSLVIQTTLYNGLAAVFAVTLVDYLYITLAILGIGKLLEKNKIKNTLSIFGSIVLIIFGIVMIINVPGLNNSTIVSNASLNIWSSFMSAFILTILSPMTIVFWTSLFATKATENNYDKKELLVFGFGAGLATLIFMGLAVILFSFLKTSVPIIISQILNILIACSLIVYGMLGLRKILIK